MKQIVTEYSFDKINIVPQNYISTIISRNDCDTSVEIWSGLKKQNIKFDIPIMLSPMSFFGDNSIKLINNRFLAFLPRIKAATFTNKEHPDWADINVRLEYAKNLFESGCNFGITVGIKDNIEEVTKLAQFTDFILVDTANGCYEPLHLYIKELKQVLGLKGFKPFIISGNVVTPQGLNNLVSSGCDLVRVNIGSGSNCITSDVSSIGRPPLTTLIDLDENCDTFRIIADGGIKNSHDLALSMLFSQWAMVSGVFKYTNLNTHSFDGGSLQKIPTYGMASAYSKVGHTDYVEGKITYGEHEIFEDVYKQLQQGLKSAMSYVNARNLDKYRNSQYSLVYGPNY